MGCCSEAVPVYIYFNKKNKKYKTMYTYSKQALFIHFNICI